jgi:hypothetical protein
MSNPQHNQASQPQVFSQETARRQALVNLAMLGVIDDLILFLLEYKRQFEQPHGVPPTPCQNKQA